MITGGGSRGRGPGWRSGRPEPRRRPLVPPEPPVPRCVATAGSPTSAARRRRRAPTPPAGRRPGRRTRQAPARRRARRTPSGASPCTARDRAPPPISSTRSTGTDWSLSASRPSASPHSMPSTAARARSRGRGVATASGRTSRPVAVGQVGGALAVEVGQQHQTAGPGRRGQREVVELVAGRRRAAARRRRAPGPR